MKAYFSLYRVICRGLVSTSILRKFKFNLNFSTFIFFLKLSDRIDNILMEGTVSQNFDLGPSFYFMLKKGKLFVIF